MKATRDLLLAAAARELNTHGYFGTDTNRIARAAGFAPATFYKHFDDKRAILLAVYDAWVDEEFSALADELRRPGERASLAARIAALLIEHHRRWLGFRACLRALVATDAVVRRHHRRNRSRQLDLLAQLPGGSVDPSRRARDAILLVTVERLCDAIADGELAALGVDDETARAEVESRLAVVLEGSS
jgi:AcrR family transcriptional regulator